MNLKVKISKVGLIVSHSDKDGFYPFGTFWAMRDKASVRITSPSDPDSGFVVDFNTKKEAIEFMDRIISTMVEVQNG